MRLFAHTPFYRGTPESLAVDTLLAECWRNKDGRSVDRFWNIEGVRTEVPPVEFPNATRRWPVDALLGWGAPLVLVGHPHTPDMAGYVATAVEVRGSVERLQCGNEPVPPSDAGTQVAAERGVLGPEYVEQMAAMAELARADGLKTLAAPLGAWFNADLAFARRMTREYASQYAALLAPYAQSFDGLAVNIYPNRHSETLADAKRDVREAWNAARSIASLCNLPIYVTEFGCEIDKPYREAILDYGLKMMSSAEVVALYAFGQHPAYDMLAVSE